MKTRNLRVMALSAIAVLAIAGAGRVADRYQGSSSNPVTVGEPSAQSADLQSHANGVFEQFHGTSEQRDASALLQTWSLNGAMDACMAEAGFPEWDWSAVRPLSPRTDALAASVFFAAPLSHSYSNAMRDSAELLRAEEAARTARLPKAESEASLACSYSTPSTSDEEAAAAAIPEIVAKLRAEWWSMLVSWQDTYGNLDEYNSCFARATEGLPIDGTEGDSWKGALASLLPSAAKIPETQKGDGQGPEAWRTFLGLEGALEAADWTCRSGIYEAHLDDVTREIDEFADEHVAEIAEAARAWNDVQMRASELRTP